MKARLQRSELIDLHTKSVNHVRNLFWNEGGLQ
jgi:hypothetical protein